MRIRDWSSDVCSSDLVVGERPQRHDDEGERAQQAEGEEADQGEQEAEAEAEDSDDQHIDQLGEAATQYQAAVQPGSRRGGGRFTLPRPGPVESRRIAN